MKLAAALVVALVLGALPLLTASNYIIGIGISALIFTVAAAALNLVYGYTGLLSFAQLGFWGIGGFFEIAWQEAAVFVIMIVVLFLRPDGLFKRGGMRVG